MTDGMDISSVRPETGQFVVVWSWKGSPWAETYKYDDNGDLLRYCDHEDEWLKESLPMGWNTTSGFLYFYHPEK